MRATIYSSFSVLLATIFVATANAQSSSASVPAAAPEATTSTSASGQLIPQKKFEETNTLTDPKLRAEAGSLSRISAKASLSYYGPTMGDLSAAEQPNPDGTVGVYAQQIKGAISTRYRVSSTQAISAGTGIAFLHPFHGWSRTDVSNPFVSYEFATRSGNFQMRNVPQLQLVTIPTFTAAGQVGGFLWDTGIVYGLSFAKGLALTLDGNFSYWQYNRDYKPGSTKKGGDGLAVQYSAMAIPGFKYNFSDSFNVYTNAGFQLYNPRQEDSSALWNRTVTVRFGAGYAMTKEIYFAPYVQTYATRFALDTTTMNVSGVFSVL